MSVGTVVKRFYSDVYDKVCKDGRILLGADTVRNIRAAGEKDGNRNEMELEKFMTKATKMEEVDDEGRRRRTVTKMLLYDLSVERSNEMIQLQLLLQNGDEYARMKNDFE